MCTIKDENLEGQDLSHHANRNQQEDLKTFVKKLYHDH